eukprot:1188333-Prorocentrum_minimum.AAC.3
MLLASVACVLNIRCRNIRDMLVTCHTSQAGTGVTTRDEQEIGSSVSSNLNSDSDSTGPPSIGSSYQILRSSLTVTRKSTLTFFDTYAYRSLSFRGTSCSNCRLQVATVVQHAATVLQHITCTKRTRKRRCGRAYVRRTRASCARVRGHTAAAGDRGGGGLQGEATGELR